MGPTPQGFTGQTYPKEQLEEAGLAQKHSWASVRVGAQGWGRTGSMRVTAARVVCTCARQACSSHKFLLWPSL